ncbi:MAG: serine/threonine-protein kinase [Myxococcales bacterium]
MLTRGSRISVYEIWGRLGEGGMSEVWLAKHTVLSVPVVIKTLRRAVAEAVGVSGAQRMFNEARLMARVTDPRVVRALDAGVTEDVPYLVQEYVDGIDLAELNRERRRALGVGLPLWLVCQVMMETCQGLHAAHQAGVIHRDVKPSNLFVAPETGVRLGDFGIAVARADGPCDEVSGTLKFMAPEQLRGGPVDRTTDVYGAGATAYDLRYGRAPFVETQHIFDPDRDPVFPPPKNPGEAYFQHLLRSMMATDRRLRPQDLAEPGKHFATLAQALRPVSRDQLAVIGKASFRLRDVAVIFCVGDLALQDVDLIVMSANYEMRMRSGCGESLRVAGGDGIEEEAMRGGERALGTCVVTGGGKLKARRVVHAVSAWSETSCVGRSMFRALLLADQLGARSVAVPALGTGAARVSMETCANAMMTALRLHVSLGGTRLRSLVVVLSSEEALKTYADVAEEALSERDEAPRVSDLGLPADEFEFSEDGSTQLDTAAPS